MIARDPLTDAQRDGLACLYCGEETGSMYPVGMLEDVQVFVHQWHECTAIRGQCELCRGLRFVQRDTKTGTFSAAQPIATERLLPCPKCR